jgi:hypothetical protein
MGVSGASASPISTAAEPHRHDRAPQTQGFSPNGASRTRTGDLLGAMWPLCAAKRSKKRRLCRSFAGGSAVPGPGEMRPDCRGFMPVQAVPGGECLRLKRRRPPRSNRRQPWRCCYSRNAQAGWVSSRSPSGVLLPMQGLASDELLRVVPFDSAAWRARRAALSSSEQQMAVRARLCPDARAPNAWVEVGDCDVDDRAGEHDDDR